MGRLAGQGAVIFRVSSTLLVTFGVVSLCYASRGSHKPLEVKIKDVKIAERDRHLDPLHHSGFGPDGVMTECLDYAEKRSKHKTTWQLIHESRYPPKGGGDVKTGKAR